MHETACPSATFNSRAQDSDSEPSVWKHTTARVIIVDINSGNMLKVQRSAGDFHGLEWSVLGGSAEGGESGRRAAVREVFEESGLTIAEGALVRAATVPRPNGDKVTRFYVLGIQGMPRITLNEEHAQFAWVRPDEWFGSPHPSVKKMIDSLADSKRSADRMLLQLARRSYRKQQILLTHEPLAAAL